jgi:hypothetical protein
MDGLNVKTEGTIAHAAVPNDWHVQDVGDFDGDAKSDILWRHDSGAGLHLGDGWPGDQSGGRSRARSGPHSPNTKLPQTGQELRTASPPFRRPTAWLSM